MNGCSPFTFGALQISALLKCDPQLVVSHTVARVVFDYGLQGFDGNLRIAGSKL